MSTLSASSLLHFASIQFFRSFFHVSFYLFDSFLFFVWDVCNPWITKLMIDRCANAYFAHANQIYIIHTQTVENIEDTMDFIHPNWYTHELVMIWLWHFLWIFKYNGNHTLHSMPMVMHFQMCVTHQSESNQFNINANIKIRNKTHIRNVWNEPNTFAQITLKKISYWRIVRFKWYEAMHLLLIEVAVSTFTSPSVRLCVCLLDRKVEAHMHFIS